MKKMIGSLLALAVCGWTTLSAVEVGKPAPDFTGKDINGKTYKLSDFKGKIVVLESYNPSCPYVKNHYMNGAMQELQADLTAKGVVWLLVNSVNPKHPNYRTAEAAKKEWDEQKLKATAWLDDSSGEIGRLYGMKTTPHMFIINKDGALVYDGAIDDQPTPSHDPRTARNYVREAVNSLLAGKPVEVSQTKPYGCSVKYGKSIKSPQIHGGRSRSAADYFCGC
jgi:peroxiredoxin